MKIFALVFVELLSLMVLSAQVTQKVVVVEYQGEQRKTALSGVDLAVADAAARISSDNGSITLDFKTSKPGDKVLVHRLQKSGYEVFNPEAVAQWTISPKHPFRIIMCRKEVFDKLSQGYWKVSSKSYRKQYEKDVKQLKINNKQKQYSAEEYQKQLDALKDQFESQLSNLDNYVKQFARIDLSELTLQEQKLIDLVRGGKISEAVALYEKLDYINQYNRQSADILKIDLAQAELTEVQRRLLEERGKVQGALLRQITTYQIAGGQENFRKAGEMFRTAAMADTTNLEFLHDYADFCAEQVDYEEQVRVIDICLRNMKEDPYNRVQALYDRALAETDLRDVETASANLYEALELANKMSDQGYVEQYELLTCNIYNKLIEIFASMGSEETVGLVKTLEPRLDSLYRNQPDQYDQMMASFLSNKAVYNMLQGDFDVALPYLEQSAAILDPYMNKNNGLSVNDLITTTYYYLSVTLNRLGDYDKALTYHLKNIDRLERLYAKNPASYALCLVVNYSGIATIYKNLKQQKKAESYLNRSMDMVETLKESSAAYAEYKFMICVNSFQTFKDPDKCREFAQMAVNLFPTLPDCAKQTYGARYAETVAFLKSL